MNARRQVVLIGHGISYSASPAMHTAAFASAGLDWTYALCDVDVRGQQVSPPAPFRRVAAWGGREVDTRTAAGRVARPVRASVGLSASFPGGGGVWRRVPCILAA